MIKGGKGAGIKGGKPMGAMVGNFLSWDRDGDGSRSCWEGWGKNEGEKGENEGWKKAEEEAKCMNYVGLRLCICTIYDDGHGEILRNHWASRS